MGDRKKFERIAAAAAAVCRSEEEQFARKKQSLASAREQAERLSAIGDSPEGTMRLLPELWCARMSRTFAEIARLDEEVAAQARQLRLAQVRRDKANDMLRDERARERIARQAKDVEKHLEIGLQAGWIRLR